MLGVSLVFKSIKDQYHILSDNTMLFLHQLGLVSMRFCCSFIILFFFLIIIISAAFSVVLFWMTVVNSGFFFLNATNYLVIDC